MWVGVWSTVDTSCVRPCVESYGITFIRFRFSYLRFQKLQKQRGCLDGGLRSQTDDVRRVKERRPSVTLMSQPRTTIVPLVKGPRYPRV